MNAVLCLNGWEGRTETPVEIVGETPKRYRIRANKRIKLAGRNRWLEIGQTALVPKYAVRPTKRAPDAPKSAPVCTCSMDDGIHEWNCALEKARR